MNLDSYLNRIYSNNTRQQMKETISSYNNGNYRSAINSLYSVIIFDLVDKLNELSSMYNDKNAKKILDNFTNSKKEQEKKADEKALKKGKNVGTYFDSSWENDLINNVKTKTELINNNLLRYINTVKTYRNSSSHPTLEKGEVELYTPEPDLVGGLINAIINELFSKSPILMGNIVNTFTDDMAEHVSIFENDDKRRKYYIQEKYLNHLRDAQIIELILNLFKISFNKSNYMIDTYRNISAKALADIISTDEKKYIDNILLDGNSLRQLFMDSGNKAVETFIQFLNTLSNASYILYENISNSAKVTLQSYAKQSLDKFVSIPYAFNYDYKSVAKLLIHVYKHEDKELENLIRTENIKNFSGDMIRNSIRSKEFYSYLFNGLQKEKNEQLFYELSSAMMSDAKNYIQCNGEFKFIEPFLNETVEFNNMYTVLKGINSNRQSYEADSVLKYIPNKLASNSVLFRENLINNEERKKMNKNLNNIISSAEVDFMKLGL